MLFPLFEDTLRTQQENAAEALPVCPTRGWRQ
jgi:hypothetical protein